MSLYSHTMPTVQDASDLEGIKSLEKAERIEELQSLSIQFIRAVTAAHGPETAGSVIDSLSTTLGKTWSSKIIFDMISGDKPNQPTTVYLTLAHSVGIKYKISLIKAIRSLGMYDLLTAKNLIETLLIRVDQWEYRMKQTPTGITPESFRSAPFIKVELPPDRQNVATHLQEWQSAGGIVVK